MTKATIRGGLTPLTPREVEILLLVAEGLRGKEIAARLEVSLQTIKGHLTRTYRKLDATNQIEALRAFGVVRLDPAPMAAKRDQARVLAEVGNVLGDLEQLSAHVNALHELIAEPSIRHLTEERTA